MRQRETAAEARVDLEYRRLASRGNNRLKAQCSRQPGSATDSWVVIRSRSGNRSVRPLLTSPPRTSIRLCGTAQRSAPDASKNALTVYSCPCQSSWMMCSSACPARSQGRGVNGRNDSDGRAAGNRLDDEGPPPDRPLHQKGREEGGSRHRKSRSAEHFSSEVFAACDLNDTLTGDIYGDACARNDAAAPANAISSVSMVGTMRFTCSRVTIRGRRP